MADKETQEAMAADDGWIVSHFVRRLIAAGNSNKTGNRLKCNSHCNCIFNWQPKPNNDTETLASVALWVTFWAWATFGPLLLVANQEAGQPISYSYSAAAAVRDPAALVALKEKGGSIPALLSK